MKKQFTIILLITLFTSCKFNFEKHGVWENNNIPENIKIDIKKLQDSLINSLKSENFNEFKSLFGEAAFKNTSEDNFKKKFNDYKNTFSKGISVIIEEQYSSSDRPDNPIVLNKDLYQLSFVGMSKNYLFLIETKKDENISHMTYVSCGLYNDKWKINIFSSGNYKINGDDIHSLMDKAFANYDERNLFKALNYGTVAYGLNNALGGFWEYKKLKISPERFIQITRDDIMNKYKFPIEVPSVYSNPEITDIGFYIDESGELYTTVIYNSTLNIKDSLEFVKEYKLIDKNIDKIIPDFYDGHDKIIYKAIKKISRDTDSVYYRVS